MADLQKTATPGIYRRHSKGCDGKGRCDCAWVIVWRHKGRQYKETCASFNEARAKKAAHESGESQPPSKTKFGDYFPEWIENFSGLTSRGFSETTRPEYRRPIAVYAMPIWKAKKLSDIDRADVRQLFMSMRKKGKSTSVIKKLRVALSALYETAIEDELVRHNPAKGVRIPAPLTEEEYVDERAKALTRRDLTALLGQVPPEWQLFFEFLTHTGLRISEAIGLTWRHIDLGEHPHVKVREQVYRGKRKALKTQKARRDIPLSSGMAARLEELRGETDGVAKNPVFVSDVGTTLIPGLAPLRGGPKYQAGAGVAGARGSRLHAPDLCASDGHGRRRCGVLRRGRQAGARGLILGLVPLLLSIDDLVADLMALLSLGEVDRL